MSSRHPQSDSSSPRPLNTRRNLLGAGLLSVAVLGSLGAITPAFASEATDTTPASALSTTVTPASPSPADAGPAGTSAYVGRNLRGVTSVSPNDVWSVGFTEKEDFSYQTLTEHWDGEEWVKVPSPNPDGELISTLLAVDAVSADDVWAVGNTGIAETSKTIIMHWDGETWTLVPSRTGELYAVTAVSADNVWAVGNYYDDDWASRTMVMHWDGVEWSTVDSPNLYGHMYSVSVVTEDDVWAAGFQRVGEVNEMLVEHWDGTSWTVVQTPSPGFFSELYGISASSPDDVWAVGTFAQPDAPSAKTLRMHWDGKTWTKDASSMGRQNPYLFGMSAVSSSKIWAVGFGSDATLTARWNGTRWKHVDSPSPAGQGQFWGVEAISGKDVWAVGRVTNFDDGSKVSLVQHWDGQAWTIVDAP